MREDIEALNRKVERLSRDSLRSQAIQRALRQQRFRTPARQVAGNV